MTISDEELCVALERRADAVPPVDLRGAARSAAALARYDATQTRGRLLSIVAAVATVAIALGVFGSLALRDGQTASQPPSAASAGLPNRSPETQPIAPSVADAWTQLVWTAGDPSAFEAAGSAYVNDGIPDGTGFIAAGASTSSDTTTGRIWRSTDGRAWTSVNVDGLVGIELDQVVRADGVLAAVGARADGSIAIWKSVDGTAWEDATPESAKGLARGLVAGGPQGLLILTSELGRLARPYVLVADADLGWLKSVAPWSDDIRLFGLTASGSGWIATGASGAGNATTIRPGGTLGAIWTSPDGVTWTPASVEQPGGAIWQVMPIAGGYLAVGSDRGLRCDDCLGPINLRRDLTTWFSVDGHDWRRATTFESGPGVRTSSSVLVNGPRVTGDGRRLIVFDMSAEFQPTTRESIDGLSWSDIQNLHPTSMSPSDVDRASGFDGPAIVGPAGIVAFRYGPDDPNAPSRWPIPVVGTPGPGSTDQLATFPPNPLPTPNDQTCPNQQPCGP